MFAVHSLCNRVVMQIATSSTWHSSLHPHVETKCDHAAVVITGYGCLSACPSVRPSVVRIYYLGDFVTLKLILLSQPSELSFSQKSSHFPQALINSF